MLIDAPRIVLHPERIFATAESLYRKVLYLDESQAEARYGLARIAEQQEMPSDLSG